MVTDAQLGASFLGQVAGEVALDTHSVGVHCLNEFEKNTEIDGEPLITTMLRQF